MNKEDLKKYIRDVIECSCCTINDSIVEKVATYIVDGLGYTSEDFATRSTLGNEIDVLYNYELWQRGTDRETLIRPVCTKHDVDLVCVETNADGNPENGLFFIRYGENGFHSDAVLAQRYGITDKDGRVLKPGSWYSLDLSSFVCPAMPEIRSDMTAEEEEEVYCTKYWKTIVEYVQEKL